jgi:hypothetical protein
MLGFGHQFLPLTINQKALRSSSGSLAKFTANRRASSRVSRFGRRATRRSDMSGIGGEAEVTRTSRDVVDGFVRHGGRLFCNVQEKLSDHAHPLTTGNASDIAFVLRRSLPQQTHFGLA